MTLHTLLFYILGPICAAVLLGKTLVEYYKKRNFTKYLIQFICFAALVLVGVLTN
jgi:amino acid permease